MMTIAKIGFRDPARYPSSESLFLYTHSREHLPSPRSRDLEISKDDNYRKWTGRCVAGWCSTVTSCLKSRNDRATGFDHNNIDRN